MYSLSGFGDLTPSLSFVKVSGSSPMPNFLVGESWQATVTGPANQPVYMQYSKNAAPLQTVQLGSTDSTGTFTLSGTEGAGDVGAWSETWYVGGTLSGITVVNGTNVGSLQFSVAAAPQAPAGNTNTGSTTNAGYTTPAAVNSLIATNGLQIGGYDIPWWAVAAVGAGLLYMVAGGKK